MNVLGMPEVRTYVDDCLDVLRDMEPSSVDLAYIDPPFFTQKIHRLNTRDGSTTFSFRDIWDSDHSYSDFIYQRICRTRTVLKSSGSLFFHCDKAASHIIRFLLDSIFGPEQFRSEIIWSFRRWSNTKKGLLPAHQTIFFYSKADNFKFNTSYQEYSPSTNIDQIMQKRIRDFRNKTIYARNEKGEVVGNGTKKGVPLSDVWEIPFLNPKAKERVGFPTQKPILLMKRIVELVTDEGDWILDPFCGSGTTLVTSKLLNRNSIGIDVSEEAVELTKRRLETPLITESPLLQRGRESYRQHESYAAAHLFGVAYTPAHRNAGIDGLLKEEVDGLPVFVRVQREEESVSQAASALRKAARNKGDCRLVVIATHADLFDPGRFADVDVIPSTAFALNKYTDKRRPSTQRDLRTGDEGLISRGQKHSPNGA